MEHYQVIARKYRPKKFSEVIGQQAIVTTLLHAIKMGRVAHAYLFSGLRGTGKTTLARLFAKALNCQERTESGEPCNCCPSCLEISSGHSLDVIEIDGASNRGIDDIRQITESAVYTPASGGYKIYIIDEVHMLTKEASNALLKTLEEPPQRVKFFFATTEPHKILPTILSRCQRFDLNRISDDAIVQALKTISHDFTSQIEESALYLIARLSEGSLRDAQSLLDQALLSCTDTITEESVSNLLGLPSYKVFFQLDRMIETQDLKSAFTLADDIFSNGEDLQLFFDGLAHHFRTLLLYKMQGKEPTLSPSLESQYRQESERFTQEHLLYCLDYLVKWLSQSHRGSAKRFELEMVLLHLVRSQNRISIESLYKRLDEMRQNLSHAASQKEEAKAIIPQEAASEPTAAPIATQTKKVDPVLPSKESAEVEVSHVVQAEVQETPLQPKGESIQKEPPPPFEPELEAAAPPPPEIWQELSLPLMGEPPAVQSQANSQPTPPPGPTEAAPASKAATTSDKQRIHYETLLRFAAVELNASVHQHPF